MINPQAHLVIPQFMFDCDRGFSANHLRRLQIKVATINTWVTDRR
jgi:hypothetical protein